MQWARPVQGREVVSVARTKIAQTGPRFIGPVCSAPSSMGASACPKAFGICFGSIHNTHQFVRGQRAGSSPLELAGGPRIKDPLAFLGLGEKA